MFSFFYRKPKENQVPEWANFFSPKEFNTFTQLVKAYFNNIGYEIEINNGLVVISSNDSGYNNLGLVNIAQICNQENKRDWKEIIDDHFERLIHAQQFESKIEQSVDDYDKIEQYLGVRLHHIEYIESVDGELTVHRNVTDEIVELLVFDFPNSVNSVPLENVELWKKDRNDLFSVARNNIKKNYKLEITKEDLGETRIWFVQSNHVYTSNIVIDKTGLEKLIGSYGALVGIPHRHAVLVYPINDFGVVKAINTIIELGI